MRTNIHVHLFSADHVPSAQVYYLLRGALHGAARKQLPKVLGRAVTTDDLVRTDRALDRFEWPWPILFGLASTASTVAGDIGLVDPGKLMNMFGTVARITRAKMRAILRVDQNEREVDFLNGLLARSEKLQPKSTYPFRDAMCQLVSELYAAHRAAGKKVSHEDVWKKFLACPGSDQFEQVVVLSVNFDAAFRNDVLPWLSGKPDVDFKGQAKELAALAKKVNAAGGTPKIIPFYGVEPSRCDAAEILEQVTTNVGKGKPFRGLKVYPPMGVLPTDDRLNDVFDYCQDNGIPVLSHCSIGGAGVRGTNRNYADLAHPGKWTDVVNRLAQRFADGATAGVFRLCLAHFDGLRGDAASGWWDQIAHMMQTFDGSAGVKVYADIAFNLITGAGDRAAYEKNVGTVLRDGVGEQVAFGSDWWNYLYECDDETTFIDQLKIDDWWNTDELEAASDDLLTDVWP